MTGPSGYLVRIERTFAAPAEDVFDAWTSPEVMRRWLHPGPDWATPEAEVDLRVGGKVRVVMRRPDGSEIQAGGEYTLIESGDMPAGSVDLTPGAENSMSLLVYNGSAILMVNGQMAATFRLTAQPIAGDIAERVELAGAAQTSTQPITMSTHGFMVWDMAGYTLVVSADEPADDSIDAVGPQLIELGKQRLRIHDHAVADDADDAGVQDAGGNEVQHELEAADVHGVARVVAALVADDQ